ncbi:MAG: O-antigen ligase family protein [Candidatus Marinimicrobia bacterium]|jgi:hypothetical protein|nr:O-antigen ligase family protein [Candidatus Neomarinimicrobiota bacterium]MBT4036372.1 O-antigen ligase family protein [Candidatus Neomarinimicrobiota bacterium]MBT4361261.1 O-antigen ligase family protein [Candidatus Neomarinimicrobiota bacterium]MBT4716094.1 O-antigen ligase family protein [Candidatus Neomarinimicrobiota bacterium]MBT4945226.1 O-antigen ligase family protein [Candidatus Neomarinimicrobiota bacterium]
MDKLALLPLIGGIFLLTRGMDSRKAFLVYFLPILTLIPAYYDTKLVSGIPEFTFWSSALIPILFVWVINEKLEGYEFSWIDVIIILHVVFIFYAQFEATGYKDAQKIAFRETLKRIAPFFMLKAIMSDPERRIPALKAITVLGAIVSLFMLYEFRFYANFLDSFIRKLWPHWVPWDGTMSRYGFKRAAGSFAHPISAGYFFAMTAPIAFWLWKQELFKDNRIGLIVFGLNVFGVITSISRAPIAGLLLGAIIIWFGWSRSKSLSGTFLTLTAIAGLSIMVPQFVEYVSVKRSHAQTQDQENAAYRKEMLDNYIEIIADKPEWGYGRYTFPVIKGQKSIDNEYLFIAITSGLYNLAIYVTLIIAVLVRLLLFAVRHRYDSPQGQLAWVLIAAWISAIFTQATVYSGMQTTHYFFMIAAISEALVLTKGQAFLQLSPSIKEVSKEIQNGYNFSRTL